MAKTDPEHRIRQCPECGQRYSVDAQFCPFDGSKLEVQAWDPESDKLVATTIDKRYRVLAAIGEGGMGTVYKVRHVTLGRHFAMKVLRRDMAREELAQRFIREAKAAASVHHPGVVEITDFGRLPDKRPYFVMELLEGTSLISMMQGSRKIEIELASAITAKIARAVGAAHAMGIVHRDLKPENVFVREPRVGMVDVKVVDFGAAMVIGASRITKTGIVYGTPHYMSPEQAAGQEIDHRADIYSLGVLFFEMVVGTVPFEADTYMEVLRKHLVETPPKPSARATGVPKEIDKVILRSLSKKAEDRYLTMESFADAIEKAAARPGIFSDKNSSNGDRDSYATSRDSNRLVSLRESGPSTTAMRASLPMRSRSQTAMIGAAVALCGTVIVVAVAHATGGAHPSEETAPPSSSLTNAVVTSTEKAIPPVPPLDPNGPGPSALAPISSSAAPPAARAAPILSQARSSPHPRDQATSVSTSAVNPPARTGDFPDPWSK
ncbi:MAG: protein kinase [Polyangiaceae bacterium]